MSFGEMGCKALAIKLASESTHAQPKLFNVKSTWIDLLLLAVRNQKSHHRYKTSKKKKKEKRIGWMTKTKKI